MTDYTELVKDLRDTERICRDRMDGQVMLDAADAIEALQAEQKKTVTQIFGEEQQEWEEYCTGLMNRIRELNAQLPKRGEWILCGQVGWPKWKCSVCHSEGRGDYIRCPWCGAIMDESNAQDGPMEVQDDN